MFLFSTSAGGPSHCSSSLCRSVKAAWRQTLCYKYPEACESQISVCVAFSLFSSQRRSVKATWRKTPCEGPPKGSRKPPGAFAPPRALQSPCWPTNLQTIAGVQGLGLLASGLRIQGVAGPWGLKGYWGLGPMWASGFRALLALTFGI